ncbi:photosystem Q domain protein [Lyngbya aestuarii BL J]|uniref:Photosystem Q domain protein n=1 Tax=Lyngbya aestuarii BL J TaxID=1348334 RepID=U7QDA7_9CYAN|nr:photosystem Q domain protein [Lyngbya aestuarii BL J]
MATVLQLGNIHQQPDLHRLVRCSDDPNPVDSNNLLHRSLRSSTSGGHRWNP